MKSLSVIILSNTLDEDIYKMNCNCLDSLFSSEVWKANELSVFLIESNKQNIYTYDGRVKLLIPDELFNFHQFLNIGIQQSNSDFIALCNNDIIFSKNWFAEILKVKMDRPDILCFSPIDRDYKTMSYELFPETNNYYIGLDNKYHFAAWCFVVDRKIFSIINKFDEIFNFYGADDDFLMTLRKYALKNVLVTKSHVKHLSQVVTNKLAKNNSPKVIDKTKYPLTEAQIKNGLNWLWDDVRFYESHFKLEKKWGNKRTIGRINRILDKFPLLRIRLITKFLYSKSVNLLLTKLGRI